MATKESLDRKVLRILFDYYTAKPGDPQMAFTDLYAGLPAEDQGVIHAEILKLQENDWVKCELTADGVDGLVEIRPKGIKLMSVRHPTTQDSSSAPVAKMATPSETSLTFVPGYRHDIFVSYTSDDDRQWIDKTLAKVKKLVEVQCSDYEPLPQWVERADWTPQARADAGASATFLIILSQRYLASDWGEQDDASFLHALRQHIQCGGNIFLLTIDQMEHSEVLPGAIISPLAPVTTSAGDLQQNNQLWQLSQNLSNELQRLRKRAEMRQKLAHKGVLIDHNPVDQDLADNVARRLKRFGVGYVFPSVASGSTPSEIRNEFEEQVLESDGLLMVYGIAPKEWLVREVQRMCRIFAKHPQQPQPNAYAIYNGPPLVEKLPEPFIFPGLVIDCRACQPNEQDCEQCPGKQAFLQFVECLKGEPNYA